MMRFKKKIFEFKRLEPRERALLRVILLVCLKSSLAVPIAFSLLVSSYFFKLFSFLALFSSTFL